MLRSRDQVLVDSNLDFLAFNFDRLIGVSRRFTEPRFDKTERDTVDIDFVASPLFA